MINNTLLKPGLYVEIYRNLNKNCFSVRHRGVVIAHVDSISLRDCHMVVQPAGHKKCVRERRKNVHAFIRGYYTLEPEPVNKSISYHPYWNNYFHENNGAKVTGAKYVRADIKTGIMINDANEE